MPTKPILFNGSMVHALMTCARCGHVGPATPCAKCGGVEFVKSQTRRAIKPTPMPERHPYGDDFIRQMSPHHPGDVLWVRESGRVTGHRLSYGGSSVYIEYSDKSGAWITVPSRFENEHGAVSAKWATHLRGIPNGIFKEAARLFLRVTDVRVQRIQEITEADAIAEGVERVGRVHDGYAVVNLFRDYRSEIVDDDEGWTSSAVCSFQTLWDSLAKPGLRFADNPWVMAYTFERCAKPEGWPDV